MVHYHLPFSSAINWSTPHFWPRPGNPWPLRGLCLRTSRPRTALRRDATGAFCAWCIPGIEDVFFPQIYSPHRRGDIAYIIHVVLMYIYIDTYTHLYVYMNYIYRYNVYNLLAARDTINWVEICLLSTSIHLLTGMHSQVSSWGGSLHLFFFVKIGPSWGT